MKCAHCAFLASDDYAFCPKCGTKLAPAPEADRRPATILFADLAGFTSLAERMDPEEVRRLQNDLFRELRDAIEHYGGFVEKFVGDAVMAVFGAPRAHEDDPERALRCALEMHRRIQPLNARWEALLGQALALHIGVNTGLVVAGEVGAAGARAYAVTGDAVNTAARLQSAATGGQTLVSRSTYRLTRDRFKFEDGGAFTFTGKTAPQPTYRLIALDERAPRIGGLKALGFSAPFVGRRDECAGTTSSARRRACLESANSRATRSCSRPRACSAERSERRCPRPPACATMLDALASDACAPPSISTTTSFGQPRKSPAVPEAPPAR